MHKGMETGQNKEGGVRQGSQGAWEICEKEKRRG